MRSQNINPRYSKTKPTTSALHMERKLRLSGAEIGLDPESEPYREMEQERD